MMRLSPLPWSRPAPRARAAELIAAGAASRDEAADMLWSAAHASLLDDLFGEGYVVPGGTEEFARLVRPIGLSADHAVLLVGAGTGGPVLSLGRDFDVHVAGFEAAATFADLAADRVRQAGLADRASVCTWSRTAPAFKPFGFDHAVALAPLGGGEPDKILGAIAAAIRPGGHFVLLEFVAASPRRADDSRMTTWLALEQRTAPLPEEATLALRLERLGFKVRMTEDVTQRSLRLAMAAWRRMLQKLEQQPSPAMAAVLMAETERWLACTDLMRAGRLKLVHWHAIHDTTQDVDIGSLKLEIMLAVQFRNWASAMAIWETLSKIPGHEEENRSLRGFIRAGIGRDPGDLAEEVRKF